MAAYCDPVTTSLNQVYAKTPKGREEVALRAAGLNSRQRSTLIMLDGQKRLDAIPALPPPPELQAVIRALKIKACFQHQAGNLASA